MNLEPRIRTDYGGPAIRIGEAVICANCDVITVSNAGCCAVCGSRSIMLLEPIIGVLHGETVGEPMTKTEVFMLEILNSLRRAA